MRIEPTGIAGLFAVHLEPAVDERGSFARLFCRDSFAARGLADVFVQASLSVTHRAGTLRGLHFQHPPHSEVKLVRCVRGAIFDVVADLRPESASYLRWQGFALSPAGDAALYIPQGCAHGFLTRTDDCEVLYQMSTPYVAEAAGGVRYDDPALGVAWPEPPSLIAEKDLAWPPIRV